MENKENNSFSFTYSAKEQEEIKSIRKKYESPKTEENKMAQLRKLDKSANSKASAIALIIGIIGALIMGTGMSIVMTDIGKLFGKLSLFIGIAMGVVGIILVCLSYPLYNRTLKKEREKIAPEILRLTEELLK